MKNSVEGLEDEVKETSYKMEQKEKEMKSRIISKRTSLATQQLHKEQSGKKEQKKKRENAVIKEVIQENYLLWFDVRLERECRVKQDWRNWQGLDQKDSGAHFKKTLLELILFRMSLQALLTYLISQKYFRNLQDTL